MRDPTETPPTYLSGLAPETLASEKDTGELSNSQEMPQRTTHTKKPSRAIDLENLGELHRGNGEHRSTSPWSPHESRDGSSAPLRAVLRRCLLFLLPSFLQASGPGTQKAKQPHSTAYLDGIRGVAALCVFFSHMAYSCHETGHGYGFQPHYTPTEGQEPVKPLDSYWRLPFVRLLYAGEPMVFLFFVISGYALSAKPVRQMYQQDYNALFSTMVSATFRRWFRLFLPCLASTLFVAVIVQMGFYESTRKIATNARLLTGWREAHPKPQKTLTDQLYIWALENYHFFDLFSWEDKFTFTRYDEHMWTIIVEFRSSLYLFVTQLGLAKCKPGVRMAALFGLMAYCINRGAYHMLLFYGGFLIAELEHRRADEESLPRGRPSACSSSDDGDDDDEELTWPFMWAFAFVVSLFLLSSPLETDKTRWWHTLALYIPQSFDHMKRRFWSSIGSILTVYTVSNSQHLKSIFESRPAQYLGRVSFSLYLMQAWVIHTFGYAGFHFFWTYTGVRTYQAKDTGFGLAILFTLPMLFWASDIFWRAVDQPTVKFGRWIESKCSVATD